MSSPKLNLFPSSTLVPYEKLETSQQRFDRLGAWFLGNRGENSPAFSGIVAEIINSVRIGRQSIWPKDPPMITREMMQSKEYQESMQALSQNLTALAEYLAQHSVPFYSPRYAGHMSTDVSLPAILGYVLAQQFNQNNVAPEASPLTSLIERQVGLELCDIIGYETSNSSDINMPVGWGHITADGSIANLESIWIARNLKYYPLSLKLAMGDNQPLFFMASTFEITLSDGTIKNFYSCDTWELLNLKPCTIAAIPEKLYQQYNISSVALSDALHAFSIQTLGMQKLNALFKITEPIQYMVSVANHYSWPKGCAITGIGSENLVEIGVDADIRMDIQQLRTELEARLERKQAIFCVVAVCGTTEHGAVDPVKDIQKIREALEKKGMSFMIHADAAWGGYFACKVLRHVPLGNFPRNYAFSIPLNHWTNEQLRNLRAVDTITIDPHKSGYIPYPAGALCLRDSRFRFLTTWTSAYINTSGTMDANMGIYGVEGSKPGATAVAVYLSHTMIGLKADGEEQDSSGYAHLLGTAMLTGIKMYGHWATMDLVSDHLVITPVNRLPCERGPNPPTDDELRTEKEKILRTIVLRKNYELEHDLFARKLMSKIGSDTMINAFVCNFKVNSHVNTDVTQSNFLNNRLYGRLSVRKIRDDINDRPLIINRTELKQKAYGETLRSLKKRAGLNDSSTEDLVVLSNVSMSPFPTASEFLIDMMEEFREVANEEITNCLVRTEERKAIHSFILQGGFSTDPHLVYLPMFYIKNHQRQLVLQVSIETGTEIFTTKNSDRIFTVHASRRKLQDLQTLDELITSGSFLADIYEGFPSIYSPDTTDIPIRDATITIKKVRINTSLAPADLQPSYPGPMPFYLYGTEDGRWHIDHALSKAPNAQLTAADVKLALRGSGCLDPSKTYSATLNDYLEWPMQPFSSVNMPAFFSPGKTFEVSISTDDQQPVLGTLTLPSNSELLAVDYDHLNHDIAADVYITSFPSSAANDVGTIEVDRIQADENKPDIDAIAKRLLTAFKYHEIIWTDNVVHRLGVLFPPSKRYSVTLGVPVPLPGDGEYFSIVSRFACTAPADETARSFKINEESISTLNALAATPN